MRYTLILLCCLACGDAFAGSIYLNNVNIDGVTNQKFEKATVRIDDKGNVFIDAPGYKVQAVDSSTHPVNANGQSTATGPAVLTKRYWLVTEQTVPGMTEFDIDVYVNSKWIRKLKNNDDQIVTEITKFLTPGTNKVLLTAHKNVMGANRKSFSPEHIYRVIIGEGNVGGDNVMIDNPIVKFELNASQANDVSQEYTLTTR